MIHSVSELFDTQLTRVDEPEPRLEGPWRYPVQMLEQPGESGQSTVHDEETAQKIGFKGAAIEGPLSMPLC